MSKGHYRIKQCPYCPDTKADWEQNSLAEHVFQNHD